MSTPKRNIVMFQVTIFSLVIKKKRKSGDTNLLPPKPKSYCRHLKQGIQEFQ